MALPAKLAEMVPPPEVPPPEAIDVIFDDSMKVISIPLASRNPGWAVSVAVIEPEHRNL